MATTTTPTPSTPGGMPQPHMQVRTCNLCRQRRVKCDRQFPRCSNCLRAEANCIYPPGRGRAPKRSTRGGVAPQISDRLARLESIINQLGAAGGSPQESRGFQTSPKIADRHDLSPAQEKLLGQDPTQEGEAGDAQSFDQEFSRLKVDESKSYYVNNPLWVTLSDEVEELRDLLFEPASEDVAHSPFPPSTNASVASPPSQLGLNAAILGYRAVSASLQHLHPSLSQAVTLFAAFTDNVAPLVRIFHMPTLTSVYWDALASLDSLDKHTEALLFAIHYSALVSLTPEQCLTILDETREAALERYRFAVEQALARGNLLNTQNTTMLHAAVLFLSALPNEDDSRAAWSLTSLVYHIARTMGLHRDGTVFRLKPFETELRRRLWWQICLIDSRSAEYHCNEPIARGFAADTKPPLHVNDTDLSPGMTEPPAERWDRATDMTLSLIRCEAIQTGWRLGAVKEKLHSGTPGGASSSIGSGPPTADDNRQALAQNLEARIREKYLPICDPSVPFQLLSSAVARIVVARFWLITHYSAFTSRETKAEDDKANDDKQHNTPPFSSGMITSLHDGPGPSTNATSTTTGQPDHAAMRNALFQTSVEILDLSAMLLTNRDILQWTWYSKTHIQWGAMAFVLSELCAPRPSPHDLDNPDGHPTGVDFDRAWSCVTAVYDGWRVGDRRDEARLALWRPIRRLMAKARYVREMQRTEPGWPPATAMASQSGRGSRVAGPTQGVHDAGIVGGGGGGGDSSGGGTPRFTTDAAAGGSTAPQYLSAAAHASSTGVGVDWYSPSPPQLQQSQQQQQQQQQLHRQQVTMGAVPTSEAASLFSGGFSSPVPYYGSSSEPSDALRRVLGTETFGPFMDLLPDWSWVEGEGNGGALSFGGMDFGFRPGML